MELNFKELKKKLDSEIGLGITFDVICKELVILNKMMSVYFLSGLVDSLATFEILSSLNNIPKHMDLYYSFDKIYEGISFGNISTENDFNKIKNSILTGLTVLLIEGEETAIVMDTRNYPTRSVSEPDTEKVIRGAHDGFTESIAINVALIRRRVKDGNLRNEIFDIGEKAPLNVCISYIDGIVDKELLDNAKKKIKSVKTDHLIMTDKALEEMMIKQKYNPYPLVRYTERPDTTAIHLYQGMFAIIVDTSPSVILAPATLLDHFQHAEEYRQTPISGTYLKILRYLGILASIFLTPMWLLMVKNNYYPGIFHLLQPKDIGLNIFIQVFIAEVGTEMLRMASIHTPSSLSTAMGLIAGVLLGDIAISVGFFSIHVVLLVSISAIGTYITPSYELGLANKVSKLIFILSILIFNIYGFIVMVILWIIYLASLKSFGKPYLYPIIPLNLNRLIKSFIRLPYKNKNDTKGE